MGWIFAGIGVALLVFVAVLLIRTAAFRPAPEQAAETTPVILDKDKIVDDLSAMIRCQTVSYHDHDLEDPAEFEKFRALLQERFPLIHAACSWEQAGRNGLLYHLKGHRSDAPTVCMAHYDVVPVEQAAWSRPAFDGAVVDGHIWGRGTLDTKSTLCGVMEALETLLEQGYTPQNDLYLAFSGEEEIYGDTCADIVRLLESRGITPATVLDEGGAVVEKVFPGVDRECALVGIAEKGGVNMEFTLRGAAGHASTPPPHTLPGRLARAITRIENNPFKRQIAKPVAAMFDTLGRHSTFLYRLIFANLWCFAPVLDRICKASGGELNAMMRTTVAVTRMQGSDAYNVLPGSASFGLNMRLLERDTVDTATAYLHRVMRDKDIMGKVIDGNNPSPCSATDGPGWDALTNAIRQTWPQAIVSPYLMMACSDSRHYCRVCDRVYRFSAMRLSKEERAMIHSHDERIPVDTLITTVEFYTRFLLNV